MSIDKKVRKKRNVRLESMWFRILEDHPTRVTLVGRRNDSENDKSQHSLYQVTEKAKYFIEKYFQKRGFSPVIHDSELASYGIHVPTFNDKIPYRFDKGGRPIFHNIWLGPEPHDILAGVDSWRENVSVELTQLYPQCWGGIIESLDYINETPEQFFSQRQDEHFDMTYEKEFIERHCVRIEFFANNKGMSATKRRDNFQHYVRGWSHAVNPDKETEKQKVLELQTKAGFAPHKFSLMPQTFK